MESCPSNSDSLLSSSLPSVTSPQQYCLKWNNYSASVTSTFKSILAGEDFVDVTLVASKGQTLKAHRVVLAACSVYFRDILKGLNLWQHPVIVLKDVPFSDLQGIVTFIYHGEVSVDQNALPSLLKSAQILKVRGLTEEDPPPLKEISKTTSNTTSTTHHSRKSSNPVQIKPPFQRINVVNDSSEEERNFSSKVISMDPSESFGNDEVEEEIDDDEDEDGDEDEEEEEEDQNMDSSTLATNKDVLSTSFSSNLLEGDTYSQIMGLSKNSLTQKKTCPYCFQQLSWHALSRHIRDMHRQQSNFVACKYCMKTFRNKNSLGCHMWRFHKDMKEKDTSGETSKEENKR